MTTSSLSGRAERRFLHRIVSICRFNHSARACDNSAPPSTDKIYARASRPGPRKTAGMPARWVMLCCFADVRSIIMTSSLTSLRVTRPPTFGIDGCGRCNPHPQYRLMLGYCIQMGITMITVAVGRWKITPFATNNNALAGADRVGRDTLRASS